MEALFSFKRKDYGIQETKISGLYTDYIRSTNSNAKTILIIHGASSSSSAYFPLLYLLSSYGYHVYVPNLPGHGKNSPISLKKIHVWDYINDLKPICDELKPDIIVGHSMGSILAQKLATFIPLKALILLSAIPPYGIKWKMGKAFQRYFYSILYSIPYFLGFQDPINRAFNKHFIFTHTPKKTVHNLGVAARLDKHPAKETPHLFFDVFKKSFTSIQPNEITCPLLLCTGEQDTLMKYETEVNIAKYYNGKFYSQPNSGHMFIMEKGIVETVAYMQNFLQDCVLVKK